jgi:hypothetical protein
MSGKRSGNTAEKSLFFCMFLAATAVEADKPVAEIK